MPIEKIHRLVGRIKYAIKRTNARKISFETLYASIVRDPARRELLRREAAAIYRHIVKLTDSPKTIRMLFEAAMRTIQAADFGNYVVISAIVDRILSAQRAPEETIEILNEIRNSLIGNIVILYQLTYANPGISLRELRYLMSIGYFNPRRENKYARFKEEFMRSLEKEGQNFRVRLKREHLFPDGHKVRCPIIALECPPGNEVFLLGIDSDYANIISFVQGTADKKAVEKAKQILGKHPAEFLVEQYLRAAIPAFHMRGIPIIFSNMASQHSYPLTKAILERFFTKQGLLNPRKRRVQQLSELQQKPRS